MKRSEIDTETWYAYHGPKAYGAIPSGKPDKIRFQSLNPGYRIVEINEITEIRDNGRRVGTFVDREFRTDWAGLATNFTSAAADQPIGARVEYVSLSSHRPGALLAEAVYADGRRGLGLFQPAGCHYTWDAWIEYQTGVDEARLAVQVKQAPYRFNVLLGDLVEQARLAGYSVEDTIARVSAYVTHHLHVD